MEFVQTVLAQIEAAKIDEASRPRGLLDELDEHRSFLQQQPGFQDMRVIRSINREGNVLLVVETRWQDDDSLVRYETQEPNVMSIINNHQELIIPNSLQVLDMEALRTEAWRGLADPTRAAQQRLALPLLVPLGILAFALLIIYGLSRVYLEVSSEVATALAAGIALGVLAMAWFLSSRPTISGWQIGSIAAIAAAVLAGGAIFAVVHDEGEAETPPAVSEPGASPTPTASPRPGGAPGGNTFDVAMIPTIQFDVDEITLPADTEITIVADNQDDAIFHNWAAYTDDSASQLIAATEICAAPCLDEVTFTAPPPGEYFFRCDVHPTQMVGTLIVE